MDLSMQELEAAINFWRARTPARGNEYALSPEVATLATVYALMIFRQAGSVAVESLNTSAQQVLQTWRAQPHSP